jgi:hypothetical protein
LEKTGCEHVKAAA